MKQKILHMRKVFFLCALLLWTGSSLVRAQATLPVNRTSSWTSAATGWSATGITHRTTSFACTGSSAAIFDGTNDRITVNFNGTPDQLIFILKEANMAGNSSMLVECSDNGTSWTTLGEYGTASGSTSINDCGDITLGLTANTRYVRWTYSKDFGNCDLDDVRISQATNCPAPSFSAMPANTSRLVGNTATFTAAAVNVTSYQWQWRSNSSAAWANVTATQGSGGASNTFTTVPATPSMNGYQYRVIATNACGGGNVTTTAISTTAGLTVYCAVLSIANQPQHQSTPEGSTAIFEVNASGSNLQYDWKENNGSGWQAIGGNAGHLAITPVILSMDGYQYMVTVRDNCGNTLNSDTAQLQVIYQPVIIVHPADTLIVTSGQTATFNVAAEGNGLNYQWEMSTDSGLSWSLIPGADRASYSVQAADNMTGHQYRATVSNSEGSAVSDAGTLTVTVPTPVSLLRFEAGMQDNKVVLSWATATETYNKGFEVERSRNGTEWQSIISVPSLANNGNSNGRINYTVKDEHPLGGMNIYRLKQTGREGAFSLSEVRKIQIDPGERIAIYPNPAQDKLFLRGIGQAEEIRILNVNGYTVMKTAAANEIHIADLPSGLYTVQIILIGKQPADRKLVIIK